ncbi:hypothetical protein Y032_0267g747 [Ancylostoma ceylanicum]|uniref:ShKT domain-containing protein n=1 Tax=Ancylostoma ceylanicum TaxID=53326 RepID=A0A016S9T0_9BILA|nr:hypothetical protein Y032_0267g747 [Ancylostoma ceylanicum]
MDLHPMCKEFKKQGLCQGKGGDFMAENCRASCGWCSEPKTRRCYKNQKLVLPVVTKDLVLDVQDSLEFEVKERSFETGVHNCLRDAFLLRCRSLQVCVCVCVFHGRLMGVRLYALPGRAQ